MPIDSPSGIDGGYHHIFSEEIEVYDFPTALVLDQLYAHIHTLTEVAMGMYTKPDIAAIIRAVYRLDYNDENDLIELRLKLTDECQLLTKALVSIAHFDCSPTERMRIMKRLQTIPNFSEVLTARHRPNATP